MASKVDLSTFLRDPEHGIEQGIHEVIGKEAWTTNKGPVRVLCRFYPQGQSGYTKISEFKIESVRAFDVGNVVSRVEGDITSQIGTNPLGRMHFILYGNNGKDVLFERQRRIAPAEDDGAGHDRALLLRRIYELETMHQGMHQQNVALQQALLGALAEANKTIATLATTRTATSSAADVSGWTGIVGMLIVLVGVPVFQRTIGLKVGASLDETIAAGKIALSRLVRYLEYGAEADRRAHDDTDRNGRPPAPDGAAAPRLEGNASLPADMVPLAKLLEQLRSDARMEEVVSAIMDDPDLKQKAEAAFLAAQLRPPPAPSGSQETTT